MSGNGAYYFPERFAPAGDDQNGIIGALLDSAAVSDTWQITHRIHHVTGTGEITTLTPPWPTFAGVVYFIGDGTWTFATGGNIAIAVTGKTLIAVGMIYNPVKGLWYPIADAVSD